MISLRGPKLIFFASILAVIALCVGIYTTFFQSQGFVKTTGTVVSVRMDTSGDDWGGSYGAVLGTIKRIGSK